MTKKTKEDKVIEKSNDVIDSFKNKDEDLQQEYIELSKQYNKLYKRYNKIIKINDIMEGNVHNKTISLEDDKKNIINISKTKILDTITSNRLQKEKLVEDQVNDKQTIIELEKQLALYQKNASSASKELVNTVSTLEKTTIKVNKLEVENDRLNKEVVALKEIATPFEEVLEKEIENVRRNNDSFVLCMIGIDNFNSLKNKLFEFTTIENFVLGIMKYLKNSLNKRDTVIYFEAEMFYIMMPNSTIERALSIAKTMGKRRSINQLNITLSAGVTALKDDDDIDSIIERCFNAYNEAITDSLYSRVIEI